MTSLTEEIKYGIVTQLAQFRGYSEVARWVRAEYDVEVDRFQVRTYDPTNPAYAASEKWRAIFESARNNYLIAVEAVPIAHKAFRLNELQRNYERARDSGNMMLANAILNQAAKEVGGALTNERNLTLGHVSDSLEGTTAEERRSMLTEILDSALGRAGRSRTVAH